MATIVTNSISRHHVFVGSLVNAITARGKIKMRVTGFGVDAKNRRIAKCSSDDGLIKNEWLIQTVASAVIV